MSKQAQSFENHGKLVPAYHYVTGALLFFPIVYWAFLAVTDFSLERVAVLLFGAGTFLGVLYARIFPLGVQDRVIRLEERMRMESVLPEDLKARIPDVTTEQIIGLRFAPDEELADLVRRALDESIDDRKVIKQAIQNWRADDQRI